MSIVRHVMARGFRDILDADKRAAYKQYQDILKNGLTIEAGLLVAYAEQLVWRMRRCRDCVEGGHCLHCKCEMPAGMTTPLFECSLEKFPPMMEAGEWEQYKTDHKIEI